MKENCVFLFFMFIIMSACTDDDNLLVQDTSKNETSVYTRGVVNQNYYSLGVSYDITNDYLSIDATKYPVVDIDAFLKVNRNSYQVNPTTEGNIYIYSGATAAEYGKDIIEKNSMGLEATALDRLLSGNIKFSNELNSKFSYSSQYSFARADVIKKVKRVYLNATPTILQEYLYPEFVRDVNMLTPDQFVAMYGTHVLLDITIGGRLQFNYRSIVEETTNIDDKKKTVEAGVKFSVGKFGASRDSFHEKQEVITWNKKNVTSKTWIKYVGGEGSGLSFTFDSEKGSSTTNFNLDKWESSVNDKNAGIIEINWAKAYPIYDFIADPTKKQQIKLAVERYINSNRVEVVKMLPLYRMYKSGNQNTFFTTSLAEAKYYIDKYRYGFDNAETYYIQGYVMQKQLPGTVPLYRLYKSGNQNTFFTTSLSEANYYIKKHKYHFDNAETSYIQGYVFKSEEPGTVPLYRLYKSGNQNTFFTTFLNEATVYINKYHYEYDSSETHYIQGYLIPNGH